MSPRSSTRRGHQYPPPSSSTTSATAATINNDLFIDPMLGCPLLLYIEKDVDDRDTIAKLITAGGGVVAQDYATVTYVLVDPLKQSGQNLYLQYAGKKGKVVLDARWIHECVRMGRLQAYSDNWANCRVTGKEMQPPQPPPPPPVQAGPSCSPQYHHPSPKRRISRPAPIPLDHSPRQISHPQAIIPHAMHPTPVAVEHLVPSHYFPMYMPSARPMAPAPDAAPVPSHSWQASAGIAPQQTQHMSAHPPQTVTDWESSYDPQEPEPDTLGDPSQAYDPDYRWVANSYYDHHHHGYATPYDSQATHPSAYLEPAHPQPHSQEQTQHADDVAQPQSDPEPELDLPQPQSQPPPPPAPQKIVPPNVSEERDRTERPRGRKRTRTQSVAAPSTSSLVARKPAARSPSPPTRVSKSTYGGNLFTEEDIEYLKKYIDYCQEQGLVLSLREICLRVAVKAPHHTFYSWRRYCNKHQIRLGGYTMAGGEDDDHVEDDEELPPAVRQNAGFGSTISAAQERVRADPVPRTRSPTPPRALFRSTTGKGVAFTVDDISFLIRLMEFRRSQGRLEMVKLWKDVAARAPHHSRASWMKFWRRHKHELNRTEADGPLPQPPEKKMRYSMEDDVLLAQYFLGHPEGTSDQVFQVFGRMHPHHPWKGWQEHYRIHKAKVDHFVQILQRGETIVDDGDEN